MRCIVISFSLSRVRSCMIGCVLLSILLMFLVMLCVIYMLCLCILIKIGNVGGFWCLRMDFWYFFARVSSSSSVIVWTSSIKLVSVGFLIKFFSNCLCVVLMSWILCLVIVWYVSVLVLVLILLMMIISGMWFFTVSIMTRCCMDGFGICICCVFLMVGCGMLLLLLILLLVLMIIMCFLSLLFNICVILWMIVVFSIFGRFKNNTFSSFGKIFWIILICFVIVCLMWYVMLMMWLCLFWMYEMWCNVFLMFVWLFLLNFFIVFVVATSLVFIIGVSRRNIDLIFFRNFVLGVWLRFNIIFNRCFCFGWFFIVFWMFVGKMLYKRVKSFRTVICSSSFLNFVFEIILLLMLYLLLLIFIVVLCWMNIC